MDGFMGKNTFKIQCINLSQHSFVGSLSIDYEQSPNFPQGQQSERNACRLFSRGVIFTPARVSLALLSLRKNGGLLVVYVEKNQKNTEITIHSRLYWSQFLSILQPIQSHYPERTNHKHVLHKRQTGIESRIPRNIVVFDFLCLSFRRDILVITSI